ncbi:plasmid mobilization relaxosome protein MobC [Auritidibacter sp. NML100628]
MRCALREGATRAELRKIGTNVNQIARALNVMTHNN